MRSDTVYSVDENNPDFLIAVCRRRPEAMRRLIVQFQARLYSFLTRMAGPQAAEDLFQEVWVQVFKNAARYEQRGKAASWIFKIAHNCARRRFRDAVPEQSAGDGLDRLAGIIPGPEESAQNTEAGRAIRAAVDALPVEQREVFALREYAGMPFKDIAETLEIPLGTALSRMNAALDKLRGKLEKFRA
jgi:RNA polymerase sigma-70 factor (ECF subfamily)